VIDMLCRALELPRRPCYYALVLRGPAVLRPALEAAAKAFPTQGNRQAGKAIRMAAVGKPQESADAERLILAIKAEDVARADYETLADDILQQLGHFSDDVYRAKRFHSALGYLTPTEFETAWQQAHSMQALP
jgi:transposase InsO family protein